MSGMNSTIETLNREYSSYIRTLIDTYGDISFVPTAERDLAAERHRAGIIIALNDGADIAKTLRFYGVMTNVIAEFVSADELQTERKVKRVEKYQSIIDWCNENPYVQVSATQIAEMGDVSYPTALKFINDRVDLFKRVKRGVYEVRNVKEERAAAR